MDRTCIDKDAFFWALHGMCTLHRLPFSLELIARQTVAPYTLDGFHAAAHALGFQASLHKVKARALAAERLPLLAWVAPPSRPRTATDAAAADDAATAPLRSPALLLQADRQQVVLLEPDSVAPVTLSLRDFQARYLGDITCLARKADGADADDAPADAPPRRPARFGFRWFVPELLRHQRLWQEILLASMVIQLLALATPFFTQTIIDKVVVHHSQSTLIVIALAMGLFTLCSAGLSWLRQYLILHTGNRVDAVLGAAVFAHLFRLPPSYFHYRPTGVIAARLHGIETIREFLAGAAITLLLDMPFLLIFVAIMFYYNLTLTLIVLGMLACIAVMSTIVAPLFQERLQQQFQLGARNQAFLTEYVGGLETVKSLQLEPVIEATYSHNLAHYLTAGFATRQLANTYNASASLIEQTMGLLVLTLGAYTVMTTADFTIGMLVAFQMFSSRLSGPLLRLVGLWQQFQQARLAVTRLGDLMNAAPEPYSALPTRSAARQGAIHIDKIAFRYADHLPFVYENLSMRIEPGQVVGLMGPSGAGKSTLGKLLQGFFQPAAGRITIDGTDIRYLPVNELRHYFGVVPQDIVLFSGTVYDNLHMACPEASFEQIIAACKMADIHAVIEALPQGYQTEIGERGAGLSGGQKQRIAIARALLKRPKILIFDEATNALDGRTADHITQTINALRGKVTMLIVAHSLPPGLQVDVLYQLGPQGAQELRAPRAVTATP